jgi:NTE family protein
VSIHRRRAGTCVALVVAVLPLLSGCATRPVNPRLLQYENTATYQFEKMEQKRGASDNLIILAFSGGGTRAAALAYGVLETLRRIEVATPTGRTVRLLDEVDLITGISGGSFTALAYGLYGEKLFDDFEQRFLKRNVQRQLTTRILSPWNWPALLSRGWGRSELAADLYDEILFHGSTFADLARAKGPAIAVGATELTTGSRVVFLPQNFDVMCADLSSFRLARAAAASSAVPVILSPITINNFGGTCGYQEPAWLRRDSGAFAQSKDPPDGLRRQRARRRYLHDRRLVPGIEGQVGTRLPQSVADVVRPVRRGGRPAPRGGGEARARILRSPGGAQGCRASGDRALRPSPVDATDSTGLTRGAGGEVTYWLKKAEAELRDLA